MAGGVGGMDGDEDRPQGHRFHCETADRLDHIVHVQKDPNLSLARQCFSAKSNDGCQLFNKSASQRRDRAAMLRGGEDDGGGVPSTTMTTTLTRAASFFTRAA